MYGDEENGRRACTNGNSTTADQSEIGNLYRWGDGMNERLRKYRIFLWCMLGAASLMLCMAGYMTFIGKIPEKLYLHRDSERELNFDMPVTVVTALSKDVVNVSGKSSELTNQVKLKAGAGDYYWMQVNLFGMIPVKEVNVTVMENKKVYPLGVPVGIYLHTGGVLVLGCGEVTGTDQMKYAPAEHILKKGDYIEAVDGIAVEEKEEVIRLVEDSGGKEMTFRIRRNGERFSVLVTPRLTAEGNYKIGIWVSDSAQGIGTLSYIDGEGNFAALGHGINSTATEELLQLGYGALYDTDIVSIKRGKQDEPGELTGLIILKDEELVGDIGCNTDSGIFGKIEDMSKIQENIGEAVEVAFKEQVKIGEVKVLCKLEEKPEYYDARIIGVNYQSGENHKDMELEITDERLLEKTGGIVQGMSGAPILQDGKLIGVVTHVLVKDPTKGYGIFIENMGAQ